MNMERIPEQELVMESRDSVDAFNGAGAPGGPLFPIYHFNATSLSTVLPENATVLDIFCGSGQFMKYLLGGRPDINGIGLDLSHNMLRLAQQNFADAGLADRVKLLHGDAATADTMVPARVDAVTCLSALHHCPRIDDLVAVFSTIGRLRERDGCAVWLFDLVRPEDATMVEMIPRMHEISIKQELNAAFKQDWMTSLMAGWTFEEFTGALREAGLELSGATANYSQLHWAPPATAAAKVPGWRGPAPSAHDANLAAKLAAALGRGPA